VHADRVAELRAKYHGDTARMERALARERFILPPGCDFGSLYTARNASDIGQQIDIALAAIEDANKQKLDGVFRNVSFNSDKLGETRERNALLKHLLEDFGDPRLDLRPSRIGGQDIIGNCYEYLIANFAAGAGKKGGEFYTPREVATLLALLVAPRSGERICDPTCGSGSLLLRAAAEVPDRNCALYGQEKNGATWALCKMNMFLHNQDSARIERGDTIRNPKLLEGDALMRFDVVVANPPFSLDKWGAEDVTADRHQRFHRGIPPKSKGDWAFISHMVHTAHADGGRVGVVVPHGVLFRGAAEGRIRRAMIEENALDAVIGLPENLFFGTGIPAALLVFKRGRKPTDVLFIDASREFESETKSNKLRPADIDRIVATYQARKPIAKYAALATPAQLAENDYNLNIPRYVDTFEPEPEIDVAQVQAEIVDLEKQLADVRKQMAGYLKELGL
jgi:type I restriction enzyme M protein